ncbi:19524_t:CDS:2 [Gigaspora margarita]|uniref:19524_t:CDS:1 n=1 Tax=Gigaspora margarita TaxID=4874 RepID=A0ABM8W180_GIGMA|nr:19524_t:CDS:2 [Gigaspora margarita]
MFTARYNDLRATSYKRQREKKVNKDRKTTKKRKFKDTQHSVVSQQGTASNLEEMDGHIQMDLQSEFEDLQRWVLETPSSIRDNAFLEFKKNLKTELKKETKIYYDHEKGQFSFLKEIKKSEVIDMKNKNEIIISRDKLNMYYLHIPIPLSMRNKKEGRIISLDPGVRSFVIGYDHGGNVVEFCKNDFSRLSRLCIHHDEYQSQSTEKIARYLCDNYQTIVLPIFETQEMVRRDKRKINENTNTPPRHVCGYVKNNLGENKKFKCDECGLIIDRDVNGARNILLKLLSQVTPDAVAYHP